MSTLGVDSETTKAEIAEAIVNVRNTLARVPAHWTDRRAGLHAQMNDLLDAWETAS